MTTADTSPTLVSDDLMRMLTLIKDSDSVELKMTVPESAYRSTAAALGLDPLQAQLRQVFFFDTPDLTLNQAGVVVRARRIQNRDGDTTIKLRPVVPSELPVGLRRSPAFVVEVDTMPGGYVCSASLKGRATSDAIRETVGGDRPLRKLFSKEQREFFATHAPDGLALDDLSVLGPVFVLKLKVYPETFARRVVVEMWIYPDGSRVAELSTKCQPADGLIVAAETRAFLASKGIEITGEQQTKTKSALEFYAAELQAHRAAVG
jgi:hypothetical protein